MVSPKHRTLSVLLAILWFGAAQAAPQTFHKRSGVSDLPRKRCRHSLQRFATIERRTCVLSSDQRPIAWSTRATGMRTKNSMSALSPSTTKNTQSSCKAGPCGTGCRTRRMAIAYSAGRERWSLDV